MTDRQPTNRPPVNGQPRRQPTNQPPVNGQSRRQPTNQHPTNSGPPASAGTPKSADPRTGAAPRTAADLLTLTGVRATGHHGVFDHERRDGQEFIVDLVVATDFAAAAESDNLDNTIHYGHLAEQVVAAIERDPVDLIETLAERLAAIVLDYPAAATVTVTVHKPHAPITVPFGDVSVTITRSRP